MCLQKFVTYTFSNREAFDRLVEIIEQEYGKYYPVGMVYIIKKYRDWAQKLRDARNSYPYTSLKAKMEYFYPPFLWDIIEFSNWDEWNDMKKELESERDIFGKVTVELLIE